MKLIIDIPREVNERLRADYGHGYIPFDEDAKAIMEAIYNGKKLIECKECKYCDIDALFHDYWCKGKEVSPNHYCGCGKRREG